MYRIWNNFVYLENRKRFDNLIPRLSGKQDDSLERQSDSPESWGDVLERQERNKYG